MTDSQPAIAWFSPLPPARSGIAAYSAELLPRLRGEFVIDTYPESAAHDFVWRHRRNPYALVVYQLGNAPCHDYMWAYLVRYPGLVVLHDARLHHARARQLLARRRFDDYRREFRYDHPDAAADVAEYAVEGLGGTIYYLWSMLRVVMSTARGIAVHSACVAADLRDEYPDRAIDVIRMGVSGAPASADARATVRRACGLRDEAFVFGVFGKVTAEKRVESIVEAVAALASEGRDAHVLLVGDADGYPALAAELARHGAADRVRLAGHVADETMTDYLAACDACLCLRWPTALESSASWLRCLAAARPTVITDLAHLADIPPEVALRVDLLEEGRSLRAAMRRLMDEPPLRDALARAGHRFWTAHHTLDAMAGDYRRLLPLAASRPAPTPADLPRHFGEDYSATAQEIASRFGLNLDILER